MPLLNIKVYSICNKNTRSSILHMQEGLNYQIQENNMINCSLFICK